MKKYLESRKNSAYICINKRAKRYGQRKMKATHKAERVCIVLISFNQFNFSTMFIKSFTIAIFFLFGAATMNAQATKPTTATQCTATTQKGAQCSHKAKSGQFCGQHDPKAATCGAQTKAGTPCKRHVQIVGEKCAAHSH